MNYDIAILGAGPGGIAAAGKLARAGRKVALVEESRVGGTCLNRGCIPTKMLLGATEAMELLHAQQRLKVARGTVEVDFPALRSRIDRFLKGSSQTAARNLAALGVDILEGRGVLLGEGRVRVEGADGAKEIEAKDIILSTGSSNATFPGMAPDGDRILDSTGLLAIDHIPESLLVVGAGAIGLELAHFFALVGTKVTIVEGAAHIAPLEDADIADELRRTLKKRGFTLVENVFAKSLANTGDAAELTLADGSTHTAERALLAVGRRPNTEGLGCGAAGVRLNKRGYVETDDRLEAAPGIHAVGDVNGRVLLAHAAEHQARYVAARILGETDAPYVQGPVPSCYYGLEIMRVGETADGLRRAGATDVAVSKANLVANPIAQALGTTQGFVKAVWQGEKLAGMAAIGHGVSHLVTQAQSFVREGLTPHGAEALMTAHPTLDEILITAIEAPRQPA